MSSRASRLTLVLAKVERADEHAAELRRETIEFFSREPYHVEKSQDELSGDLTWRVRVREETPLRWSTIVGDAIHSLRSALDHLVWQLVLANGGTPGKKTAF